MAKMSRLSYYFLVFVLLLVVAGSFGYAYMADTDTTVEDIEEWVDTELNHPEETDTPHNVDVNMTRILSNVTTPATDCWAVAIHYQIGHGIKEKETYGTNWTVASNNDSATDNGDRMSLDINQTDLDTPTLYTYGMTVYDDNYTANFTKALTVKLNCDQVVFILASKNYATAEYHIKIAYGDAIEWVNLDVHI
jgi:hypothetical protein